MNQEMDGFCLSCAWFLDCKTYRKSFNVLHWYKCFKKEDYANIEEIFRLVTPEKLSNLSPIFSTHLIL